MSVSTARAEVILPAQQRTVLLMSLQGRDEV